MMYDTFSGFEGVFFFTKNLVRSTCEEPSRERLPTLQFLFYPTTDEKITPTRCLLNIYFTSLLHELIC